MTTEGTAGRDSCECGRGYVRRGRLGVYIPRLCQSRAKIPLPIATRSTEGDFSKSALFSPPDAELNLKAIMGLYSENIGGQRQPLQPL